MPTATSYTLDRQQISGLLVNIFEKSVTKISTELPSDWVERKVVMKTKPFPGPFRYSRTPYTRQIANHISPNDQARVIAFKKAGQVGGSAGIIYAGIAYSMENCPANTWLTVGAPDLIDAAVEKLDMVIDSAGLKSMLSPQTQRVRNQKTGDTNKKKEYPGGYTMITTVNNHKAIRQLDLGIGYIDDWEAARQKSKESGSTRELLEHRFTAYKDTKKIFYISTPEKVKNSNIEEVYQLGDQRKYYIPCPCCASPIELLWEIKDDAGNKIGGIDYELDEKNELVPGSVKYLCPECGDKFDDSRKMEWLNKGFWQPTVKPKREGYVSYYINALYSPTGMSDWEHYTYQYLEANPVGQPRKEAKHQTFMNLVMGEGYDRASTSPKANQIQKNCREYEIGTIPEKMSMEHGNGRIVLITLGADMNGKIKGVNKAEEDDARLDWEIVAHSETGATYSIEHGSIGTFVSANTSAAKLKNEDRIKYTYEHNAPNSVWPLFEKVIARKFTTDTDGRKMPVLMTALDSGYGSTFAYVFLDKQGVLVKGVKGKKDQSYETLDVDRDMKAFKKAVEREKLYILTVGMYKENLSEYMALNWHNGEAQPPHMMNFPMPSGGLYTYEGFFKHYEAEERKEVGKDNKLMYLWEKKTSNAQNHFWDTRIYNLAAKDIFLLELSQSKKKNVTWREYATMVANAINRKK